MLQPAVNDNDCQIDPSGMTALPFSCASLVFASDIVMSFRNICFPIGGLVFAVRLKLDCSAEPGHAVGRLASRAVVRNLWIGNF